MEARARLAHQRRIEAERGETPALEEGREVFAVPGELTSSLSAGTNALLKLRSRRPAGDELLRNFYDRLFEAAPAVKPLFANVDMERQRQALLNMLVVLRESLRDLDDIVPDLKDLGARHAEYGAQPAHYPVVGEVLIAAMTEVAGDKWKPE
jgi:hypothetical protein